MLLMFHEKEADAPVGAGRGARESLWLDVQSNY